MFKINNKDTEDPDEVKIDVAFFHTFGALQLS